jgi:hypothetical protein
MCSTTAILCPHLPAAASGDLASDLFPRGLDRRLPYFRVGHYIIGGDRLRRARAVAVSVVAIAGVIAWPAALVLLWTSAAALTAAERCTQWPRAGLVMLAVCGWCLHRARRMLPAR